jgi:hypothetical protein
MLLQGRKFNGNANINCVQWNDESIKRAQMLHPSQTYSTGVLETLRVIDGGITPEHYTSTMDEFQTERIDILQKYLSAGAAVDYSQYASAQADAVTRAFARQGISRDFSSKCWAMKDYVSKDEMVALRTSGIDCMIDILNWIHRDKSDPIKFNPGNSYRGADGVQAECWRYVEKFTPSILSVVPPMIWINNTLSSRAYGRSLMDQAYVENDFLQDSVSDGAESVKSNALLIAELYPPDLPMLRTREVKDVTIRTVSQDSVEYMERYSEDMTCIELDDVKERLPPCDTATSVILTEEHCDQFQDKIKSLIYVLARPILDINTALNSYPPANSNQGACYLDCGIGIDSDFSEYPGISNPAVLLLIKASEQEAEQCKERVRTTNQCVSKDVVDMLLESERVPNYMSRSQYIEKKCGAVAYSDLSSVISGSGGLQGARYECEFKSIRTTGNPVVNWATEKLISVFWKHNPVGLDIDTIGRYSNTLKGLGTDLDEWLEENRLFNMTTFINEVVYGRIDLLVAQTAIPDYYKLTPASDSAEDMLSYRTRLIIKSLSETFDGGLYTCGIFAPYCIPEDRNIVQADFHTRYSDYSQCFAMYYPEGEYQCTFAYDEGLSSDILASEGARNFETPVTKKQLPWVFSDARGLSSDVSEGMTQDYGAMVYTLYVGMVRRMMDPTNQAFTTKYIRPVAIDFFDIDRDSWLDKYSSFDLSNDVEIENMIDKVGQDCDSETPSIAYGECDDTVTTLYDSARNMFEQVNIKDGATIVPPHNILVWPGIPLSQHISSTLPAWSMHGRADIDPKTIFARWIFDKDAQCIKGTVGNSVCTLLDGEQVAMNPWLGGDFNPWEKCDTVYDEGTSGTTTNEAISVSCNTVVCDDDTTVDSPYYVNQPNANCLTRVLDHETQVHEVNVASSFESNLCKQQPLAPVDECEWKQGMMQGGLRGRKLTDDTRQSVDMLYSDQHPRYTYSLV